MARVRAPNDEDIISDALGRAPDIAMGAEHGRWRLCRWRQFVSSYTLPALPDPMFVTDTAGTVTMAKHRIEEYLGPDLKGTPLTILLDRIVAPAHRRSVDEYLKTHGNASQPGDQGFVRFVSPGGSHFVMRSAPVVSDDGKLVGLLSIRDLVKDVIAEQDGLINHLEQYIRGA